jgi:hypothetical protein
MNDWETDSKLKAGVVKENECLREEVAALKKEVAALKREKAAAKREKVVAKKEPSEDEAKLIELITDSEDKGSFDYLARVFIALYKNHNKGHEAPNIVSDELEQYRDTFLWESIRKGIYSDDIADQCREALRKPRTRGMEKVLLDRWMRIINFLPGVRMRETYYYADIMADDGYYETKWLDIDDDKYRLSRGLCFYTKEAAIAFSEKMA